MYKMGERYVMKTKQAKNSVAFYIFIILMVLSICGMVGGLISGQWVMLGVFVVLMFLFGFLAQENQKKHRANQDVIEAAKEGQITDEN